MTADCSLYRSLIPRAATRDLSPGEQQSLKAHLVECAACARDQAQYEETLRLMRSVGDVPVPRHFFVYQEAPSLNPWHIFRQMSLVWQGTVAAVTIGLLVFAVSAATRLNIHAENGSWVLSFGKPAVPRVVSAPAYPVDVAAIEARVLKAVDERDRREKLEWIRTMRAEMEKSNHAMTERQRKILQTALSGLEARFSGQLTDTVAGVESRSNRAIFDLYQLVSSERASDLAVLDNRVNRLAANGEIRGNQTDAILETLLQVADLNLK